MENDVKKRSFLIMNMFFFIRALIFFSKAAGVESRKIGHIREEKSPGGFFFKTCRFF